MSEITASFRQVLVALANRPTNPTGLAVAIEKSITTARKHLATGVRGGYIKLVGETYSLTEKGEETMVNGHVSTAVPNAVYARATPSPKPTTSYIKYVQPHYNHDDFRPGSMDAYRLPSLAMGVRLWP